MAQNQQAGQRPAEQCGNCASASPRTLPREVTASLRRHSDAFQAATAEARTSDRPLQRRDGVAMHANAPRVGALAQEHDTRNGGVRAIGPTLLPRITGEVLGPRKTSGLTWLPSLGVLTPPGHISGLSWHPGSEVLQDGPDQPDGPDPDEPQTQPVELDWEGMARKLGETLDKHVRLEDNGCPILRESEPDGPSGARAFPAAGLLRGELRAFQADLNAGGFVGVKDVDIPLGGGTLKGKLVVGDPSAGGFGTVTGSCAEDRCIVVVVGAARSNQRVSATCAGQYCIAIAIGSDAALEDKLRDQFQAPSAEAECGYCGLAVAVAGNATPIAELEAHSEDLKELEAAKSYVGGTRGANAYAWGGDASHVFAWGGTGSIAANFGEDVMAGKAPGAGGDAYARGRNGANPRVAVAVGGHGGDCVGSTINQRGGRGGSAEARGYPHRCAVPGRGGRGCARAGVPREDWRGETGTIRWPEDPSENVCKDKVNDVFA